MPPQLWFSLSSHTCYWKNRMSAVISNSHCCRRSHQASAFKLPIDPNLKTHYRLLRYHYVTQDPPITFLGLSIEYFHGEWSLNSGPYLYLAESAHFPFRFVRKLLRHRFPGSVVPVIPFSYSLILPVLNRRHWFALRCFYDQLRGRCPR